MYEEIPEEQVGTIDSLYQSLHTAEVTDEIKQNGDDNDALNWVSEIVTYMKNPSVSKPNIIFA